MAYLPLHPVLRRLCQAAGGPAHTDLTDSQLLERFVATRDEAAFTALVQRHGRMVLGVCQSFLREAHDAEDAFQATFLVLVRQAGAVRNRNSLSGWLYGVAYRTALKARASAAARRTREQRAAHMAPTTGELHEPADTCDLRPVLAAELNRLPEKYRVPVLLCYVEGKTTEETARQLGWPRGTVATRLAQARTLLRGRLGKRGVTLSMAALPAMLAEQAAAAGVPSALTQTTLRAALHLAAQHGATAGLPGPVATLVEGVLRTMHATKLRLLTTLFLTLTLVGGAIGLFAYHSLATPPARETLVRLPDDPQAAVLRLDLPEGPYLTVRADGTAVFGNPRGDSRQAQARLSAGELQDLLRFVVRDNAIFDCDTGRLEGLLHDAPARSDASFVLTVRADGREHEVHCRGLSEALVRQRPEAPELNRLWAVRQRLERVATWVQAGGREGVAAAVRAANAELQQQLPDAPPLTAADLQTARLKPDRSAELALERRGLGAQRDPFTFVYARLERTAAGQSKVVVKANLPAGDVEDTKPPQRPLNIEPRPIAIDKSVKYDYDIVYVRAPRFVKDKDGKDQPARVWPDAHRPTNMQAAGADLMILHPDGTEEVLVAAGKGSVADPYVSFDGEWVYYAYFHDPARGEWGGGADIYKVHAKSRKIVRLTQPQLTPNTGVAAWSKDFRTPEKDKANIHYNVYNIGPCPLPGGRVAFTSNRDAVQQPHAHQVAFQLFVMDDDGGNVDKIGHINVAGALHPVILKDGRIIFSTFESQGMRNGYTFWGIWSIHPDGTNWGPIISAFGSSGGVFHFQTQLSDTNLVIEDYYHSNTLGFGSHFKLPAEVPADTPPFYSAGAPSDQRMYMRGGIAINGPGALNPPFRPYRMESLTRFGTGADDAAAPSDAANKKSPQVGKVTHPCGAPDNHLLTVWTAGPGPVGGRLEGMDSGIYLIKGGKAIWEPGEMLLIKNDPNYNEQWPRPLVPYKRVYGVDEPKRLTHVNDGKKSAHLPEGTPFGLVGTSSLYKRESFPRGVVAKGDVTAKGDPYAAFGFTFGTNNWGLQGADAGLYDNSDIHAIRILAMEPPTQGLSRHFYNRADERLRILGEIPVRKFQGDKQPIDPDGNPDTSFLAKIPADMAWTFQTLDKDGMVLNMAQTWHQLRPGEIRTDCGGCHAHSQKPTLFQDTAAARPDYKVFDLTKQTPLLVAKKDDQSRTKWDKDDQTGLRFDKAVKNVEYFRDIKPILTRSCVVCHNHDMAKPAGGLVLDADTDLQGAKSFIDRFNSERHQIAMSGPKAVKGRTSFMQDHKYARPFQSRRSMLIWKVYGRRTDGLPEKALPGRDHDHKMVLAAGEYKGSVMPPPEAVAGTYEGPDGKKIKVEPLNDEDRRTLVRWIDLGCPIDFTYDPAKPQAAGYGWMLDDQRPTLTLTHPEPGANKEVSRLLVGMHDYGTGLDMDSFTVTADFPLAGVAPGENLAKKFQAKPDGIWELALPAPLKDLSRGKLLVSVKDKQGNVTRIERTFSIAR